MTLPSIPGYRLSRKNLQSFSKELQDWINGVMRKRKLVEIGHMSTVIIFPVINLDSIYESDLELARDVTTVTIDIGSRPDTTGLWYISTSNENRIVRCVVHSTLRLLDELIAIPEPDLVGLADTMIALEGLE